MLSSRIFTIFEGIIWHADKCIMQDAEKGATKKSLNSWKKAQTWTRHEFLLCMALIIRYEECMKKLSKNPILS